MSELSHQSTRRPAPPSTFRSWVYASVLAVVVIVGVQLAFGFSGPSWWGASFLIGVFAFQGTHAARWEVYERRLRAYWRQEVDRAW
jgi:hypothetical protein